MSRTKIYKIMEDQLMNLPNGNFAIDNVFFDNGVGFLENLTDKYTLNKDGIHSLYELNSSKWLDDDVTYLLDDILDGKATTPLDDAYVSFDVVGSPVGSPLSSSDESSCDLDELLMSAYPLKEVLASACTPDPTPLDEHTYAAPEPKFADSVSAGSLSDLALGDDEMEKSDILEELLNGSFDLPLEEDESSYASTTIDMASLGLLQVPMEMEDTQLLEPTYVTSCSGKVDSSKKAVVKETRAFPYKKKQKTTEQKQRKKCQNRTAASRYRNKKKQELDDIFGEADELEEKNKELRDKVGGLKNEIDYLKNLMLDVIKVRLAKNGSEADLNLSNLLASN